MLSYIPRAESGGEPLAGFPGWFSDLLRARGVRTPEDADAFLNPSPDSLHDPLLMPDMDRAAALIRDTVDRGLPILVWGDYDVDGMCAAALLSETLAEMGADVSVRIPLRHSEGYGLNAEGIEAAKGAALLITVDCGISNVKEVALARELGMRVIVTDHHQLPETLPEADAVLSPLLGDYPCRCLCGAGVALKLCHALQGPEGALRRLDLAALATVADVVPLTGENRVIVHAGLRVVSAGRRPGLRMLIEAAGLHAPLRADDLAFRLAPRLNAAGRLGDASLGVRLLTSDSEEEGRRIALQLDDLNRRRQDEERRITAQALQQVAERTDFQAERVLFAQGEGWNPGLIGLTAGRLCERFHYPAIVLSVQGDTATGSCRSVPGVHIFRMLEKCADLLVRFGGHEQAAGLTVAADRIPELRARLNREIREACPDSCFAPAAEYDLELGFGAFTRETVGLLDRLEPCGCGNPSPLFLTRNVSVQQMRKVGRDGSHLKLSLLDPSGTLLDGIAFSMGEAADRGWPRVDVLSFPSLNEWNGRVSVQAQVRSLRPAEAPAGTQSPSAAPTVAERLARLQENGASPANDTGTGALSGLSREEAAALALGDEALRGVYRLLRRQSFRSAEALAAAAGITPDQATVALTAFAETNLVRWTPSPFSAAVVPSPARCRMDDSPTLRALRALAGSPAEE